MTTLRDGPDEIPVVARLKMQERSQLSDVQQLYVYSQTGPQRVPLAQVSSLEYRMETEKIKRRNQFRTITISCDPVPGTFPSELLAQIRPDITKLAASLPAGYKLEIGGEDEEQIKGFQQISIVLMVSVILIFLALVFQFRSAAKPLIVFAAIPYGVVGALVFLALMHLPFGFMGFLGVSSLIGVIVSHVIVLFDFIEEAHEKGESLENALLNAGILRLRPVLITVSATVFALFPLAIHGGPLWEPMCYAQIGGLTVATVVTLVLVPVIYSIFVLDLKIVKWGSDTHSSGEHEAAADLTLSKT
jgi:multidrug efflux pump subunit AcrB